SAIRCSSSSERLSSASSATCLMIARSTRSLYPASGAGATGAAGAAGAGARGGAAGADGAPASYHDGGGGSSYSGGGPCGIGRGPQHAQAAMNASGIAKASFLTPAFYQLTRSSGELASGEPVLARRDLALGVGLHDDVDVRLTGEGDGLVRRRLRAGE